MDIEQVRKDIAAGRFEFSRHAFVMKKCEVCGNTVFHQENVDEFFRVGGDTMLVEQVPAQVCDRCGETTFSCETVEKVRKMVQEHSQPTRKIEVETFAFA